MSIHAGTMQQARLGRTNLKVGVACLGSGGRSRLGQSSGAGRSESIALVRTALDLGIDFIDTAPRYGTEEIVGEALLGIRDGVLISTKCAVTQSGVAGDGSGLIAGPGFAREIEDSLTRLRTDRIDILQLHGVDRHEYGYCVDELVPALIKLRDAGKVRYFGITERFNVDTRHAMLELAAQDDVWDVLMVGYNFLNQTAASTVLPHSRKRDIGTMCMYAVRGGLADHERAARLVSRLVEIGEIEASELDVDAPLGFLQEDGRTIPITEAAYRFCRHTPGIDVVLTGTGDIDHLKENVGAIQAPPLPDVVLARLKALFSRVSSESGNPLKSP